MISESECKKRSKFVQEILLRVKMDDGKFLFGSVLFSHYENDYVEFYRTQFRGIAIQDQKTSAWRMDSTQYQTLNDTIQVTVSKNNRSIKFGPLGHIIISSKGLGIGTYLISKVIDWCKINYPDYAVRHGGLSSVDASIDNKERRNAFYRNRGFRLRFSDQDETEGSFSTERSDHLDSNWNREKIQEISMHDFIVHVGFNSARKIMELKQELRISKAKEKYLKERMQVQKIVFRIFLSFLIILFFLFTLI
jgi:hypothetical protein